MSIPRLAKKSFLLFRLSRNLIRGARLILWTFRAGKELDEAVEFCRKNGIEFYAVNKNYPEEIFDETISRKIDADIFIDDKNMEDFPGGAKCGRFLFRLNFTRKRWKGR